MNLAVAARQISLRENLIKSAIEGDGLSSVRERRKMVEAPGRKRGNSGLT
jgi:hypothetical protein